MMVSRVNEAFSDIVNAMKPSDKEYHFVSANEEEIDSNRTLSEITKAFEKNKDISEDDYNIQVDLKKKKLRMTFDARKVPNELVDDFKSGGKYDKYVNSYDPHSYEVEMFFNMEKNVPTSNDNSEDSTDNNEETESGNETESVMAPTPTPYEYKPSEPPEESDDLIINEDLEMTDVEPTYDDATGEMRLTTEINGRKYDYTLKDDSPLSIDQLFSKVNKMMKFSKGKALAFLKKHAVGTLRVAESKKCNPFKSSFICQGCGNTLNKCTCEIDVPEDDDETTPDGVLVLRTEGLISQDMLRKRLNDKKSQMTDEEYDEWIEMMKKALNTPDEGETAEEMHDLDELDPESFQKRLEDKRSQMTTKEYIEWITEAKRTLNNISRSYDYIYKRKPAGESFNPTDIVKVPKRSSIDILEMEDEEDGN